MSICPTFLIKLNNKFSMNPPPILLASTPSRSPSSAAHFSSAAGSVRLNRTLPASGNLGCGAFCNFDTVMLWIMVHFPAWPALLRRRSQNVENFCQLLDVRTSLKKSDVFYFLISPLTANRGSPLQNSARMHPKAQTLIVHSGDLINMS